MTSTSLPSYSQSNPHPTAVIRELRYMARNGIVFHIPTALYCMQAGLIESVPAMSGEKLEITRAGRLYIEKYSDYDPELEA